MLLEELNVQPRVITRKHFKEEEDLVIIQCIKENPVNLLDAFDQAAKLLVDRDALAINKRWYNSLRKTYNTFMTASSEVQIMNSKVQRRDAEKLSIQDTMKFVMSLSPSHLNVLKVYLNAL